MQTEIFNDLKFVDLFVSKFRTKFLYSCIQNRNHLVVDLHRIVFRIDLFNANFCSFGDLRINVNDFSPLDTPTMATAVVCLKNSLGQPPIVPMQRKKNVRTEDVFQRQISNRDFIHSNQMERRGNHSFSLFEFLFCFELKSKRNSVYQEKNKLIRFNRSISPNVIVYRSFRDVRITKWIT